MGVITYELLAEESPFQITQLRDLSKIVPPLLSRSTKISNWMSFETNMLLILSNTLWKKIQTTASPSSSFAAIPSFPTFSKVIKTYDFIIFFYITIT
jgi:hypothetical protein